MRKDKSTIKREDYKVLFWLGMAVVFCQMIPYIVLGEGTVIRYHDQLDGEMIGYILQAKYLFQGEMLPEFMGGSLKTALTMPAPGFVLLFCTGQYFLSYVLMHLIEIMVAYIGMYLLAKEMNCNTFFAVVIAGVFSYLPFFPVYGLSQFGIPLLIWFWIRVGKNQNHRGAIIYSFFYAFCSSLVLVGFGILLMMFVEIAVSLIKNRCKLEDADFKKCIYTRVGCMMMAGCVYVLENMRLIFQMLGIGAGGKVVSHKIEYALERADFKDTLRAMLIEGGSHSLDYHVYIILGSIVGLIVCILWGRKIIDKIQWKKLIRLYVWIVLFIFLAAFWESNSSVYLRNNVGILGSVNFSRVMWITPTLWYLSAAMILGNLNIIWNKTDVRRRIVTDISAVLFMLCFVMIGIKAIWNGEYAANVCRIIQRDYKSISFEEYYAVGVLDQVKDYIYENTKEEPKDYKVLSLGIDPAAAYYHGFYCLDGYSNNYSVEYKHKFREIIAPELNKNDYLRSNYDNWGCRCYLWYDKVPGYFTIEKGTSYFWDYDINTEAAKEMGAKYILSAVYIVDAEETGLKLVREEPFETEDSYYAIFLYEIQ